MNITKIKCDYCGDVLTDGELQTHEFKSEFQKRKKSCYQCTIKHINEARDKYNESLKRDKVVERMDEIEDQKFSWGAPRGF